MTITPFEHVLIEEMIPFIDANFRIVILNLLLKELCNLVCVDLSHTFFRQFSCCLVFLRICLASHQPLFQAF